jgi:membrane-associated phospholipid phosphatase
VIFPAEVHLRDSIDINNMHPIFASMFETLWFLDSPYNSWPSLHVSSAGIFTLFAIRWWKGRPILQWAVGIWWVLMTLSILTTKQHFILDLVTGLMILGIVWRWQVQPGLDRLEMKPEKEVTS